LQAFGAGVTGTRFDHCGFVQAVFGRFHGYDVALFVADSTILARILIQFYLEDRILIEQSGNPGNGATNFMILVHLLDFTVFTTHAHQYFHNQSEWANPPAKHFSENDSQKNAIKQDVPQRNIILKNAYVHRNAQNRQDNHPVAN